MPGDTVEERIVADVIATLDGIAAGAEYYTDVERVYEMEGSVLDDIERPAIVVLHQGTKQKYGSIDQVECRIALTLWLGMDRGDGWQKAMRRFVTDVVKALRVDCGRGVSGGSSNAFDTHIVGHDVANEGDGFPIAVAEVDIEIQYRHLLSDPTVAL